MSAALRWLTLLALWASGPLNALEASENTPITVGSKAFGESHILAELTAQLLEDQGFPVQRRLGLGGTMVAYQALQSGSIDLYPEYTGTLEQSILAATEQPATDLLARLQQEGLQSLLEFGFNNSYALVVPQALATDKNLSQVSQLAGLAGLRLAFSHEFLNRADGWPALRTYYQLPQDARGIEHALAYGALKAGELDVSDAYTTDGQLQSQSLVLLADDQNFFPRYEALLLARDDLDPAVAKSLQALAGALDEKAMQRLNAQLAETTSEPAEIAHQFLQQRGLLENKRLHETPDMAARILHNTLVHLQLTVLALAAACLVAIPLSLAVYRRPRVARVLLYGSGLVQTIPSLALLALLIPLIGLGKLPAVIALFLYSLLPIARNTITGLLSIDPILKETATAMGLTPAQQLRRVELPLAMPTLLAGIKTAAIISIGTATLAAFVGAGGLGEPIITGLSLNDNGLILQGAIPAILLALVTELIFEGIERILVPRHLRQ